MLNQSAVLFVDIFADWQHELLQKSLRASFPPEPLQVSTFVVMSNPSWTYAASIAASRPDWGLPWMHVRLVGHGASELLSRSPPSKPGPLSGIQLSVSHLLLASRRPMLVPCRAHVAFTREPIAASGGRKCSGMAWPYAVEGAEITTELVNSVGEYAMKKPCSPTPLVAHVTSRKVVE